MSFSSYSLLELMNKSMIQKIISGGQTGADRAGLDWAIKHGVPHGGWCPLGRRAFDGPLDAKYQLTETPNEGYLKRTRWNVRDSDATIVFTLAEEATGGSLKTLHFAQSLQRPYLHLHAGMTDPAGELIRFLSSQLFEIQTLNIAGSNEGKEPGIYSWVMQVMDAIRI